MTTPRQIIHAMATFGGSWAKALAEAFARADDRNFARLQATFPDVWEEYTVLAQLHADQVARGQQELDAAKQKASL